MKITYPDTCDWYKRRPKKHWWSEPEFETCDLPPAGLLLNHSCLALCRNHLDIAIEAAKESLVRSAVLEDERRQGSE